MPKDKVRINICISKTTFLALNEYVKRRFVRTFGAISQVIEEALKHYINENPPPDKPKEYPKIAPKTKAKRSHR